MGSGWADRLDSRAKPAPMSTVSCHPQVVSNQSASHSWWRTTRPKRSGSVSTLRIGVASSSRDRPGPFDGMLVRPAKCQALAASTGSATESVAALPVDARSRVAAGGKGDGYPEIGAAERAVVGLQMATAPDRWAATG